MLTRAELMTSMALGSAKEVERAFDGMPIPNDEETKFLRHHIGSLVSKSYEDGFKQCLSLLENAGCLKLTEQENHKPRIIRPK